jgi:Holliday junction resolvase-like predicted endonuclease
MSRTPQQRQGDWAEQRALRLLREQGWWILERQWRCRWGELDLLLHKPGRLLLVEVKLPLVNLNTTRLQVMARLLLAQQAIRLIQLNT